MRAPASHPRAPGLGANVAVALVLCLLLVVVLRPSFHTPGSAFDEGFALAYPVRVLEGDVPHRDFSSFYGPGNPWLLAGAFAVAGRSQDTERVIGILYRLLLVLGAAAVAGIAAGRWAALAAGGLVIAALVPIGAAAYAAVAALGCAVAAIAALATARGRDGGAAAAAAGGLLAGTALLMRPDFFLALVLPAALLLAGGGRRRLVACLAGFAPALLALLVHLAIVGPDRLSRVVSDMRASGPGRELPFDALSPSAVVAEPSRLLLLTIALALAGLAAAAVVRRRERDGVGWRTIGALALLTLGLVPYALSRLDYVHVVVPLACALALAPVLPGVPAWSARTRAVAAVGAGAVVLVLAVKLARTALEVPLRTQASIVLGRTPETPYALVRNGARSFSVPRSTAPAVQQIVDAAERARRAGARTLVVAPADLRRAFANDTYLYFLLADLQPATRYMEFNPLTVNRARSGLVDDLRRADLLILNSAYDNPGEPNESLVNGPDAPNDVVRRLFCEVGVGGTMRLLRRCRS